MIIYRPFRQISSACNHSYTSRVTVSPSCTTAGELTYTCSKCNDQYTVEISAYGHTLTDQYEHQRCLATPATCTDDATYYYECVRCSHNTADEGTYATWTDEGSALGHIMTQYGYNNTHHWNYCTRDCGHTEDTEIHNVTSWTSTPISDTQVKLTGVCTICGQDAEHIHDINATEDCPYCDHVHNWILIGEPQRENGICTHSVKCTSCDVTATQNFNIHNDGCDYYCNGGCSWVEHSPVYQYIELDGEKHSVSCELCSETWEEPHNWETPVPLESNHSMVNFWHRTVCENCGVGKDSSHNYSDGVCTECGYTCPHTNTSDATCTDPSVCANCGAEVGVALGHIDDGRYIDFNNATCTFGGSTGYKYYCTRCKTNIEVVTGWATAKGHTTRAATCLTDEYCTECGWVNEGSALGHNMLPATCTKPSTCSRCGLTSGSTIEHTWELDAETSADFAATCTNGGQNLYYCTVCQEAKVENTPALGHDYTNLQVLPCSSKCYTKTCSRCSNAYTHLDPKCEGPHIK